MGGTISETGKWSPIASTSLWLRREGLSLFLCVAIPLICVLVANPFVKAGFNDDWSYSHVALSLANTAHIHYNGWGPATQLFQAVWGAAWIRLLGFSFDLLRIISLPFSLGFVWLVYLLGRKAGLRGDLARFGALVVGTSPLYIPLAASFMTEGYSCFFTALCLYAAICSAGAAGRKSAVLWLWALAISGILGGSDRQSVWSAPLVLIPYLLWVRRSVRRSDRRFSFQAVASYIVCIGTLLFLVSRFTQPYPGIDFPKHRVSEVLTQNLLPAPGRLLNLCLACLQVILPALLCFVPFWRKLRAPAVLGMLIACGGLVLWALWSGLGVAPFASSVLSGYGILGLGFDALGYRPVLLPSLLRIALGLLIVFSGLFFCLRGARYPGLGRVPRDVFVVSSCVYMLLLIPSVMTGFVHDRYVLPLMPALVVFVLHYFQAQRRAIPVGAWASLIVLAAYGTVVTHDYASAARARVQAAQSLEARGIPRSHISAGLEYDGWTQLQLAGTVTSIRYGDLIVWNATNRFWFWDYTKALHPEYAAVSSRSSDQADPALPRVAFTAWTLPFRRAVIVKRLEDLPQSKVCTSARPCSP